MPVFICAAKIKKLILPSLREGTSPDLTAGMQKTNFHTHTARCGHASGEDEQYVRSAIRGGYRVLGFSDHTPWSYASDFVSPIRMPLDALPD